MEQTPKNKTNQNQPWRCLLLHLRRPKRGSATSCCYRFRESFRAWGRLRPTRAAQVKTFLLAERADGRALQRVPVRSAQVQARPASVLRVVERWERLQQALPSGL